MERRLLQTLAVSVFLFAYPLGGTVAASESHQTEDNTYVVGFHDSLDKALIEKAGGETEDVWERIEAAAVTMTDEKAAWLSSQPEVDYVELDEEVQVNADTDTELRNWGLNRVEATDAWDHDVTGAGVDVAVVDTGISTSHPSLDVEDGYSAVSYTDSYDDDNGHGSHAAGIIAANQPSAGIVGVAPDADLYAVKVLDEIGSGSLTQVLNGMEWAIDEGVDIINMSFGTLTNSQSMKSMLDAAYDDDIIVAAASGNRGESSESGSRVEFPARFESVVAVGAVDEDNERAYFSATGDSVELAAPGVDIVSSYEGSSFGPLSGTSMATPFVVGGFALMKEAYPEEDAAHIRETLQDEALDLGSDGRDEEFGYGLLQLPDLSDVTIDKEEEIGEEESTEQPVEEDIEDNPISDDPIDIPEEDENDESASVEVPSHVDSRVSYNEDGSANVTLSWDRSDEDVRHQLYRDGNKLEVVDSGNTSFIDQGVPAGSYQYEVTAIGANDEESEKSEAVEVTVEEKETADEANGFSWPEK
ncbi:peptidase S8/S53 subtilisin kexin sedolisin [Salibacterium salarium]|uniref:Peptidase S8/S53 subtilisin kexin sedolisin n=1 Tax=Salibacterium salarium TaxID=284579 RepID=A0A3R9R8F3_9BACI|nr:S8 family peptidase [Salibacterium salarium]RSL29545.1 peptidase S8/S53 subtilisin kexin sedolisin [Salibacterium salarium]